MDTEADLVLCRCMTQVNEANGREEVSSIQSFLDELDVNSQMRELLERIHRNHIFYPEEVFRETITRELTVFRDRGDAELAENEDENSAEAFLGFLATRVKERKTPEAHEVRGIGRSFYEKHCLGVIEEERDEEEEEERDEDGEGGDEEEERDEDGEGGDEANEPLLTEYQVGALANDGKLRFDNFIILEVIGEGQMGVAFLGYHIDTPGEHVVIKMQKRRTNGEEPDDTEEAATSTVALRTGMHRRSASTVESDANRQKFTFEKQCATSLSKAGVSGIPVFAGSGVDQDGDAYYAVEHINGKDLKTLLEENGPLEDKACYQLIVDIANLLVKLEKHGLVHRDIKPENILVTHDGKVYLLDFGIAIPLRNSDMYEYSILHTHGALQADQDFHENRLRQEEENAAGSAAFMNPDLIIPDESGECRKPTPLGTDGFALQVVAFTAATGNRPYTNIENGEQVLRYYHEHGLPEELPKPGEKIRAERGENPGQANGSSESLTSRVIPAWFRRKTRRLFGATRCQLAYEILDEAHKGEYDSMADAAKAICGIDKKAAETSPHNIASYGAKLTRRRLLQVGVATVGCGIVWLTYNALFQDTEPPKIILHGDNPLKHPVFTPYTTDSDPGFTATDDQDGDITNRVEIDTSRLDTNTPGVQMITYTVTDNYGRTTTAQRTIEVVDVTPPKIKLLGPNPLQIPLSGNFYDLDPGYEIIDDVDGPLEVAYENVDPAIKLRMPGAYVVKYKIKDTAGNESIIEREVIRVPYEVYSARKLGSEEQIEPWIMGDKTVVYAKGATVGCKLRLNENTYSYIYSNGDPACFPMNAETGIGAQYTPISETDRKPFIQDFAQTIGIKKQDIPQPYPDHMICLSCRHKAKDDKTVLKDTLVYLPGIGGMFFLSHDPSTPYNELKTKNSNDVVMYACGSLEECRDIMKKRNWLQKAQNTKFDGNTVKQWVNDGERDGKEIDKIGRCTLPAEKGKQYTNKLNASLEPLLKIAA